MKDKRCDSDFKHINTRIDNTNLAFPLGKVIFPKLGSSKCEVLLVIDLKDTFHSLRLIEESRMYCIILSCLVALLIYCREWQWD